jgi:hypothetical protein
MRAILSNFFMVFILIKDHEGSPLACQSILADLVVSGGVTPFFPNTQVKADGEIRPPSFSYCVMRWPFRMRVQVLL